MQYFNIYIASQMSGVAAATIRAWEKRYSALTPFRTENGHRLYNESDIQKLTLLGKLTQQGHSIGKIAKLPYEELEMIFAKTNQDKWPKAPLWVGKDKVSFDSELQHIMMALAAYKLDIISHELEKARKILSPRDFALEVMVPLVQQIGYKVANQELSIAQEHSLSAIITFHAGQLISQHYTENFKNSLYLVIAAPEGELHDIGLLAACLICIQYRIKFIFLGPNLPSASLSEALVALKATHVILGVAKGHEQRERQNLVDYVRTLHKSAANPVEIWIGGSVRPNIKKDLQDCGVQLFQSLNQFEEKLATI